jgi:hypothetical protein
VTLAQLALEDATGRILPQDICTACTAVWNAQSMERRVHRHESFWHRDVCLAGLAQYICGRLLGAVAS